MWTNPDLGPIVSWISSVGDTVLLEVQDQDTDLLAIVALDARTGEELHRIRHFPSARLGGMRGLVDYHEDEGIFFRTDADESGPFVAAVEIRTGRERWRVSGQGRGASCGERVCRFNPEDGSMSTFDATTGELVSIVYLQDTRILASVDDLFVFPGPVRAQPGEQWPAIIGLGDYGKTPRWTIDLTAVAEMAGHGLTPDGGWRNGRNDTHIAQYIGSTFDVSQPRSVGDSSGATFGYSIQTGEVGWVMANMIPCSWGPKHDVVFLCEVEFVVPTADDPRRILHSLRGIDIATGEEAWKVPVTEEGVFFDAVSIDLDSEVATVTTPNRAFTVDRLTGETSELPPTTELVTCVAHPAEEVTISDPRWTGPLSFMRPERLAHCESDGTLVDFANALRRDGVLSDRFVLTADSGWMVGTEDGVLTGVYLDTPGPEA